MRQTTAQPRPAKAQKAPLRLNTRQKKPPARPKAREQKACVDAIAALEGTDKDVAECLHRVVTEEAPHLDAKTWYGFPSYAQEGKIVVFYQPASKFDTRYGTIGFQQDAHLDDGDIWATSFAVVNVTDAVEGQIRELVRKAAR